MVNLLSAWRIILRSTRRTANGIPALPSYCNHLHGKFGRESAKHRDTQAKRVVQICGWYFCHLDTWWHLPGEVPPTPKPTEPLFHFIMEEEKNDQLPFLDVLVCRAKDKLRTSVYHKPTYTDRYINYNSHNHSGVFRGAILCVRDRAYNVCDETSHTAEFKHLHKILALNGYPTHLVKGTLKRSLNPAHKSSNEQSRVNQRENGKNTCLFLIFEVWVRRSREFVTP